MQKALIFSLGFLIGIIACWNLRVTVSRQDVFDIKNSIEKYRVDAGVARTNLARTLDKIEECRVVTEQIKYEILRTIGETCKYEPVNVK